MSDSSFFYVPLTFVVGSTWITLVTIAAEKWGSRWGGFIGGLPSTSLVSLLFIALNQSPEAAADATSIFPLSFGFSSLFLLSYAILSRKGFLFGFFGSFMIYAAISYAIGLFKIQEFWLSLIIYAIIFFFSLYIFEKKLNIKSKGRIKPRFTLKQIIFRALFSGAIMAIAVLPSKWCGPICGGIFAAFPAVFTSTIFITYKSSGMEFSRSMTKPLFVSGMITIIVYVIAVRYTYPSLGLILGTLTSLLIFSPSIILVYWLIQKKLS